MAKRWWQRRCAVGRRRQSEKRGNCSAPAFGTIRGCLEALCCRAACTRRPIRPASAASPRATRTNMAPEPVRTATLAYDAVALVAALSRRPRARALTSEVLLNSSGFSGIDGLFRFRPEGTNERGLAVMRVARRRPDRTPKRRATCRPRSSEWGCGRRSAKLAKSATTASSTGKPACVTRSRPSASTEIAPSSRNSAMRRGVERPA